MRKLRCIGVSSEKLTASVDVTMEYPWTIVHGAPILRKFKGQPLANLLAWMSKQPGFDWWVFGYVTEDALSC